jgi:hypothetical protein
VAIIPLSDPQEHELSAPLAFTASISSFRDLFIEAQEAVQLHCTGSVFRHTLQPCWFSVTVLPKPHGRSLSKSFEAHIRLARVDQYDIDLSRLMIMRAVPGTRVRHIAQMSSENGHGTDVEDYTSLHQSERLHRKDLFMLPRSTAAI